MNIATTAHHTSEPSTEADLLILLDQADLGLRSVYQQLAENPDRANADSELQRLRQNRSELAFRVGIDALKRYRLLIGPAVPEQRLTEVQRNGTDTLAIDPAIPAPVSPIAPIATSIARVTGTVPSEAQLTAWKDVAKKKGLSTGVSMVVLHPVDRTAVLSAFMDRLLAPRSLPTYLPEEIAALERAAKLESGLELPQEFHKPWLALLVCRTRAIQDVRDAATRQRTEELFRALREWSHVHKPGYLVELQSSHRPPSGTWSAEATNYWSLLETMLGERKPTAATPNFKVLDSAPTSPPPRQTAKIVVSERIGGEEPEEPEESEIHLPKLAALNKPIVVFGGEADLKKLERIQNRTCVTIEWATCEQAKRLARRIRKGHVAGIVALEGLGNHPAVGSVKTAAQTHGVLFEYAGKGGISSILAAVRQLEERAD